MNAALTTGVALFTGLASAASITLHWRFDQPAALDRAYFLQRVWQAAHGVEPCRTVLATERGEGLWMGKHLEPILALFVPGAWAGSGMEPMLVLQALILGLGAIPTYLIGRRVTGDRVVALLLATTWLCSPLLWRMACMDFRTLSLAAPLLLGAWTASSARRLAWALALSALALACREEVAWFLLLGLPAAWWIGRAERRRWVIPAVVVLAVLWIGLATVTLEASSHFVHLPRLAQGLVRDFGRTVVGGAVAASDVHPLSSTLLSLLHAAGPSVVLLPFAPLAALPALTNAIGIIYAPGLTLPIFPHYLAPTMAAQALAWPLAIGLAASWARRASSSKRTPRTGGRRLSLERLLAVALLLANVGALVLDPVPGMNSAHEVLQPDRWPVRRSQSAWPLILQVPQDAVVLTDDRLIAALGARAHAYDLDDLARHEQRDDAIASAGWAVIGRGGELTELLYAEGFELVASSGEDVLMARPPGAALSAPVCLVDGRSAQEPDPE